MPIYEYECTSCGDRSELLQRMGDPPPDGCGKCGQPLKRLLSAPSFQFKGTGWYVTDYADKGKKGDAKGEKKSKDSGGEASEAKSGGSDSSSGDKAAKTSDKSASSSDSPAKSSKSSSSTDT